MAGGHHIHRQSLILEAPGLDPKDGWYDRLARLHEFRIVPALEASLDGADDGTVRLIDRLEIEITVEGADRMEEAVSRQLKARLDRVLQAPPAPATDQRQTRFAQLLSYLRTGNLPWAAASPRDLRALFREWLADADHAQWTALFREWRQRPTVFLGRCTQVNANWEGEAWRILLNLLPEEPASRSLAAVPPGDPADWVPVLDRLFGGEAKPSGGPTPGHRQTDRETPSSEPAPYPPEPDPPSWPVGNAGLVILHPYLRYLMDQVGCTDPGRAATLFHYLVYGNSDCGEWDLPLTKVLLGYHPSDFLLPAPFLEASDQAAADELLAGVIGHWKALKNTGIHAFRDAFLLRPGALIRQAPGWRLTVEQRPQDLLLERLPWGIGLVRTTAMREVLHVDWR